jgi:export-related chaperone CsaA
MLFDIMLQDEKSAAQDAPAPLPRADVPKETRTEEPRTIRMDEFKDADLRIGKVVDVKVHEGARKPMYVLSVDLGKEIGIRTIVAGIREFYSPEELLNKKVVCLVNLEPKTIAGVVSCGMVLAADSGEKVSLLVPDRSFETEEGSRIR